MLTRGDSAINIHFDLDTSGVEGLTFVIATMTPEVEGRMDFDLVAECFTRHIVTQVPGLCSLRPDPIRCVSHDGCFSAQAVQSPP